jgi:hypothetical protein
MSFHSINKEFEQYHNADISDTNDKLSKLRDLPFYCYWEFGRKLNSPNCSFNHTIGMSRRLNMEMPLFNYQKQWFNTLANYQMIYILKCTSAGATEFMIRYLSWLCLKDDKLKGSQIVVVTGPRIETSISIIERMKHLFLDSGLVTQFNTKHTVCELNSVRITAFPSDHLDAARGTQCFSIL